MKRVQSVFIINIVADARPSSVTTKNNRSSKPVKQDKPADHQLPGYGWTLKKLRRWVEVKLAQRVSRTTLRTLLKQAGLSWKKSKKVLINSA